MSRRSDYWFLYPLLGPLLGLVFILFLMSFGGKVQIPNLRYFFFMLMSGGVYLWAYMLGGIQALFVGICDGLYAWKFGVVPGWLPLAAALFSFIGLFLVMGRSEPSSGIQIPLGTALINLSPLLLTHLFAAVAVWFLIKLIYRPVEND
jgi:hypothetical protein